MRKIKPFKQENENDCGPACLKMVAAYYGNSIEYKLLKNLCLPTDEGVSLFNLAKASEKIGLKTIKGKSNIKNLSKIKCPFIAYFNKSHYVVVYKTNKRFFYVADPSKGMVKYSKESFSAKWNINKSRIEEGYVLIIEPTPQFYNKTSNKSHLSFFKELLSFLKPHKKAFVQIIFALLIGSMLQIFLPILSQLFIDKGINASNKSFIVLVLVGQVALTFGTIITDFIKSLISLHLGTLVNISIVSDFLMRILSVPLSYFENKKIGDLLQKIYDNNRIERFLTQSIISVIYSVFNLFIFSGILFLYDSKIFIIFCLGSIVYLAWIILLLPWRKKVEKRLFELTSSNTNVLLELFRGVSDLKFFNIEESKRWEWEKEQASLYIVKRKMLVVNQIQNSGSTVINMLKNYSILYIAALTVIDDKITLGMFFAIQFILAQANAPIGAIMSFIQSLQFAKISFDRLKDINTEINVAAQDLSLKVKPKSNNITFYNVGFYYSSNNLSFSFNNLYLEIPENKTTVIVGESGSGKTTLLKLLLKYYSPNKGKITIGGDNLNNIDTDWWYQNTGIVLQDSYIFSNTLAYNIALNSDNINTIKLQEVLKLVNLEVFVESLPLKLNTMLGKGGHKLSQGQRQRILIARLFYRNPKFVFMDEATNSLDSENEVFISENLKKFLQQKTAVIVDHKLSTILYADKIIVIDKGKVIEEGTHHKLMANKSKYFQLINEHKKLNTLLND